MPAPAFETVTVRRDNLTLDLLLTVHRGLAGQRLLEQVLDLNPGLAGVGSVLPHGTVVLLPDGAPPRPTDRQSLVVSLFG